MITAWLDNWKTSTVGGLWVVTSIIHLDKKQPGLHNEERYWLVQRRDLDVDISAVSLHVGISRDTQSNRYWLVRERVFEFRERVFEFRERVFEVRERVFEALLAYTWAYHVTHRAIAIGWFENAFSKFENASSNFENASSKFENAYSKSRYDPSGLPYASGRITLNLQCMVNNVPLWVHVLRFFVYESL